MSGYVHNVRCFECGDVIKIATKRTHGEAICDRCMNPKTPSCGNGGTGRYFTDDGGNSWDDAVRMRENFE